MAIRKNAPTILDTAPIQWPHLAVKLLKYYARIEKLPHVRPRAQKAPNLVTLPYIYMPTVRTLVFK